MRLASARNVDSNPVSVAAARRVAAREAAGIFTKAPSPAEAARRDSELYRNTIAARRQMARSLRRQVRLERIERFLNRPAEEPAEPGQPTYTIAEIAKRVCWAHGVSMADLKSERRHRKLVLARQCVCFWAKQLTGKSYPTIGRLLGGRDHTTIMHSVQRYRTNAALARAKRRKARVRG